MAEIHDKGPIPLDHVDGKVSTALDVASGNLAAIAIDLNKKQFSLWWQPSGWVAQRESYGAVDLTSWQLIVHDGAAKLVCGTWGERSPDGQAHLDVIVLKQLY